jgi:hypothetical protein
MHKYLIYKYFNFISLIIVVITIFTGFGFTTFNVNQKDSQNPPPKNSQEEISFTKIGSIKRRHAKDIKSNNWSIGAETMDRDYTIYDNWKQHLGPLGIKKARLQAGWAKTEKQKGQYNWAWLDNIIFDMVEDGVEPWMNVSYGNPNYGGGTRLGADMPKTEEAIKAWTRWVSGMANRYKNYIDEWEIWNEGAHGGNTMDLYVNLYIPAAEAIREVQPDATIMALAIAGVHPELASEFLEIMEQKGKLHLVDQITYHPYNKNPDDSYEEVAELRAAIDEYSERITIRQGENGAPSMVRKTKALSGYEWSELSQAKWALRRLLGDLGRDISSSYFAIMDMKYPDEMNRKGLLHANEDKTVVYKKPAYYAVQNLTSVFDYRLKRIPHYPYIANNERSMSLFVYENKASNNQVVTIWFDGEIPSNSNDKININFTFPNGQFNDPVYVDLRTGKVYKIPEDQYTQSGTKYVFKNIPVYDSPVLIADRSILFIK